MAKLKEYAFKRFLKTDKVSILRRDNGKEFHIAWVMHTTTEWNLAKFKLVIV